MARKKPPTPDCAKLFYRVAAQRLPEAIWILEKSDRTFTTVAVYIGGYAVECALKAVLLARSPRSQHQKVKDTFRGQVAHDFHWLREQLWKRGVRLPVEVSENLGKVDWWSTDLRYHPGQLDADEAGAFLDAATVVVEWAKRSV